MPFYKALDIRRDSFADFVFNGENFVQLVFSLGLLAVD